ncbi:hypothetical protein Hanom_Chr13g01199121 [Helianthus anomalus]
MVVVIYQSSFIWVLVRLSFSISRKIVQNSIFLLLTMGKGKAKAKKGAVITTNDDGSGEEKLPVRRRGRPTKAQKEVAEKIIEKTETKLEAQLDHENKRKRPSSETEESLETMEDENGADPKASELELTKAVGFRHNGSRRKNKPRRAAEVGVSVCEVCTWLVLRS